MKLAYRNDLNFTSKKIFLIPVLLSQPSVTVEFYSYRDSYPRGFGTLKQLKFEVPKTVIWHQYLKYPRQEIAFDYTENYQLEFVPNQSLKRIRLSLYVPDTEEPREDLKSKLVEMLDDTFLSI